MYFLIAAKHGAKLTPHTGNQGEGADSDGDSAKVSMTGTKLSMPALANFLARRVDRPVIDNTGISGEFDVKLEWSPDQTAESPGPSIFTALQELLGLRLEAGRGPVKYWSSTACRSLRRTEAPQRDHRGAPAAGFHRRVPVIG